MSNSVFDEKWKGKLEQLIEKNPGCYLKEFANFNTGLSYRSLHSYVYEIAKFLKFSGKPAKEVGFDDYTGYMAEIRRMVPSCQVVIYSALKRYSRYLFVSEKTDRDYMEKIDRPNSTERQSTISKREKAFLSDDEIPKFLQNVRDSKGYREAKYWKERDMLLIYLFLNTGLRCSGVWKLDLSDIDFENKILITTEKRGKVRTYILNDELIAMVSKWLVERQRRAKEGEKALFVSEKGTRLSTDRIAEIVHSYASGIEGKSISPHKLRATFGTQVYSATNDIYLTQEVMGHKNPTTTELYIRGRADKNMQTAADIMQKITMQSLA